MAAALAVVVGGWLLRHGLVPLMRCGFHAARGAHGAGGAPGRGPAVLPVLLPSADAEGWLNDHPRRALVRVPAQMAVTELEDQIATMDDQLNAVRLSQTPAPQLAVLQRDRAQLVESLAQVRYAQNLVAGLP